MFTKYLPVSDSYRKASPMERWRCAKRGRRRCGSLVFVILVARLALVPTPAGAAGASGPCTLSWTAVGTAQRTPPETHALSDVAFTGSDSAWAVGAISTHTATPGVPDTETLIEHWSGATWVRVPSPSPAHASYAENRLDGVAVGGPRDVWAVGFTETDQMRPLVEHWDGISWTASTVPAIASWGRLRSVAAASTDDVWAVGSQSTGSLVLHWDGLSWTEVDDTAPANAQLFSIDVRTSSDVWAVGFYLPPSFPSARQPFAEHWDGSAWTSIPTVAAPLLDGGQFSDVAIVGTDDVWAVGIDNYRPLAAHWNGSAWSRTAMPGDVGDHPTSLAAVDSDDVVAVGFRNQGMAGDATILVEQWDGASWTIGAAPTPSGYAAGIAVSPNGEPWIVGGDGLVNSQSYRGCDPSTATALVAEPNPSTFGSPVALTASVSHSASNGQRLGGSVNFYDGTDLLGSAPLDPATGQAELETSSLATGAHQVKAVYSGDENFDASTSVPVDLVVNRAPTQLAASPAALEHSATGMPINAFSLSARLTRVDDHAPVVGEVIQFRARSQFVCTATTNSDGVATCRRLALAPWVVLAGGYTATFQGSHNYGPSSATAPLV